MHQCAWLVDMGYVVKAARDKFKIDYVLSRDLLATRFVSVKPFLFNSFDESYGIPEGLEQFYAAMRHEGMEVLLHPMSGDERSGTHRQRRVDVDFACHALWQATLPDIRTIVLTTGDQDMIPAVKFCRTEFQKSVFLFTFDYAVHPDLQRAVDDRIRIEDYRDQLERL